MISGWLGETKVSCILRHRGFQLILAYSWARLAILAACKGREKYFISLLSFIFLFLSCHFISSSLLSLFFLSLGGDTKRPTRVDVSLNHNTINQADPAMGFTNKKERKRVIMTLGLKKNMHQEYIFRNWFRNHT